MTNLLTVAEYKRKWARELAREALQSEYFLRQDRPTITAKQLIEDAYRRTSNSDHSQYQKHPAKMERMVTITDETTTFSY